jgi:hypothetical protein
VTPPADARGDGENLLAAFNGQAVLRTRPIYWRYRSTDLAVREGDWKLVTTVDGQQTELHNLKSNRAEDVAKDQSKAHPEIVTRLSKMVHDWYATLPTKPDPTCVSQEPRRKGGKQNADL